MKNVLVVASFAMLMLSGCKKAKNEYVAPPPPEVTVTQPVLRKLPETLEATAQTRGFEEVEVRARVRGFLLQKHTQGGVRVEKDALLFTIDPREYVAAVKQAEADLAAKQAVLSLAEVTLGRVEDAFRQQAAAQFEVDKAVAERDAAKAMLELAQATLSHAKLDLEFTQMRAPMPGRVSIVNVDIGQLVGAGEPTLLATIINDSKMYAAFDVDERRLLDLRERYTAGGTKPGERANLAVRLGLANEQGYPHVGRLDRVDNTVNPGTGTIRVDAIFDNADGVILPGLFARAQAVFEEKDAMLVPEVAMQMDQTGRYVLAVGPDEEVVRHNVTVGPVFEGMRMIESGLEPTARVIVAGIQRARPGAKVTVKAQAAPAPASAPAPAATPAPAPTTSGSAK